MIRWTRNGDLRVEDMDNDLIGITIDFLGGMEKKPRLEKLEILRTGIILALNDPDMTEEPN